MKSKDIRKEFVKFFESKNHGYIPSGSLIPNNDPTLLFTNAGMVPFKDAFTGKSNPKNKRAVSIQKCVRAGGKHNDLENVGFTARHHTFFEMMGNFSFGDYFKEEAIAFAWEFLIDVLKLPKEKIYITVHTSDQQAADIWHEKQGVPKDRIFFLGDKDNFWEMGETGPCGPSSEIFYDHGPENGDPSIDVSECLLNDEDRYIEIWNLVFMQYEKYREGKKILRRDLPKPSVDTGGGLERFAAALQGVYNNFDSDVFTEIISAIEKISGKKYKDHPQWMRVVADHARACTMLLSDGVIPANEGRGYVVRRIIRRAVRHLDLLGVKGTTFYTLVNPVVESLGEQYHEVVENKEFVEKYLKLEEAGFRKALSSGLKLLENLIAELEKSKEKTLSGDLAFNLYDTHGFPVDLTEMILKEQGFDLDFKGFEKAMASQKERSKKAGDFSAKSDNSAEFYKIKESKGDTEFVGYETLESDSILTGIVDMGETQALIFDKTPFYAEGGGQQGDVGEIFSGDQFVGKISDCKKPVEGVFAHVSQTVEALKIGGKYKLVVDANHRSHTIANHTGTHLLQAALIDVLGKHVKQAGSNVGPQRLRFDFTHPEGVSKDQLREIESSVNRQIQKSLDVGVEVMSKDAAVAKGAMALFGEKYGDQVRVIDIPNFSVELCGGTHVKNTKEIGYFKILSERSLATGIRRIEAVTNVSAFEVIAEKMELLDQVEGLLKSKGPDVVGKVQQLQENLHTSLKDVKSLQEQIRVIGAQKMFDGVSELKNGTKFKYFEANASDDIRKLGELFIDKFPQGIVLISSNNNDRASVLLKTFKGNGQIKCSDILKESFGEFGGKGGGKPDMAQGSLSSDQLGAFVKKVTHKIDQVNI